MNRLPLTIEVVETGHKMPGVLCAVAVDDLNRLEAVIQKLVEAAELAANQIEALIDAETVISRRLRATLAAARTEGLGGSE